MIGERFRRAKEIFLAARELEGEEREALVTSSCGDDVRLLGDVHSLLRFNDQGSQQELLTEAGARWEVGDRVGAYRLVAKLGEGGMGVVFEAEQEEPVRRRVALKLIRLGVDTREVLARFDAERQSLALMDHPAIARVLEAGSTEQGRPFFAMELVAGEPITAYCDHRHLAIAARLRLFVEVCRGVQHAHQKGIIHRDLKPSNVLVAERDGRPEPKIIDFGIAKATAPTFRATAEQTRAGEWVGTPEYMSPEHAGLGDLDVDTRSDVYSLGVILHELLVGSVPFELDSTGLEAVQEVRRRIRDETPRKPSTAVRAALEGSRQAAAARCTDPSGLSRTLQGDLDTITLKAIEKDRERRYASAAEFAADIERHLSHEPVTARPPGTVYRLGRLIRRNRVTAIAATVVAVALGAGTLTATLALLKAEREEAAARQVVELLTGVFQEMDPTVPFGQPRTVQQVLDLGTARVAGALAGRPAEKARILATIGQAYTNLGQYDSALRLLEQALALQREHLGPRDPGLVPTLASLTWVHGFKAEFPAARRYAEEAAGMAEAAYGPDDTRTLGCHASIGWLLWKTGRYTEAAKVLDRSLATAERSLGPSHPRTADLLFFRALLLRGDGRLEEARRSLERCLAIRESALGPDHMAVGWALHDLGVSLRGAGELDQSRLTLERALAIQEKALGPDHPAVASPLCHLGIIDLFEGKLDASRDRLERSLAVLERALGPEHPETATSLNALAVVASRTGDAERSLALLQRSLAAQEKAFDPEHPELIRTRILLAVAAHRAGRVDEARVLGDRAEQALLARAPGRSRSIAIDIYNLACLRGLEGSSERALELLRMAVAEGYVGPGLANDPDLDSLRRDPRFAAIVATMRARAGTPRS